MTKIQKSAELAMALAMADQLEPQTKTGRLKSLFQKLEKTVISEFQRTGGLTKKETKAANQIVIRFADISGWEGKPRHICTKINFLLALYDDRPWGARVIRVLNDIYQYFERIGDAPASCLWAGALAVKKWEVALNG